MHRTNPFGYSKPITLDSLDDLFSHHRAVTGGWTMTATPPEPQPTPTPTPPAPAPTPTPPPGDQPPTYTAPATQADLDRIIGDRIARERAKYADYDDMRAKAEAHDAAVEAAKSEAEKAVDVARKEGETAAIVTANARIVKSETRALAAEMGFASPTHVAQAVDLSQVKVSDDGEPDTDAIKAALEQAKESGGFVINGKGQPKPDHSQGGGGSDSPKTVKQVMEERRAARAAREGKQ